MEGVQVIIGVKRPRVKPGAKFIGKHGPFDCARDDVVCAWDDKFVLMPDRVGRFFYFLGWGCFTWLELFLICFNNFNFNEFAYC